MVLWIRRQKKRNEHVGSHLQDQENGSVNAEAAEAEKKCSESLTMI